MAMIKRKHVEIEVLVKIADKSCKKRELSTGAGSLVSDRPAVE